VDEIQQDLGVDASAIGVLNLYLLFLGGRLPVEFQYRDDSGYYDDNSDPK
jgi:hypothetical protein